jgi:formamidopyrimidine-DNA glycosylase
MPELPEVETTRRALAPVLEGDVIAAVAVRRERMIRRQPRPADFSDRLRGRLVVALRRHGKFLLADLDGDLVWVLHLGMSGRMSVAAPGTAEPAHTNVVIRTGRGDEVRFVDPRTFGFTSVLTSEEYALSPLALLGPDAFDDLPRSPRLAARLAGRTAPIKALLLDQRFLAGLGNIYADEVLWRARIAPDRPGGSLTADEVAVLRRSIRPVLRAALDHGGTSLSDLRYLIPDGRAGEYLPRLAAYGREDEPCRRCGTPIRRATLRARSTYWCQGCQR